MNADPESAAHPRRELLATAARQMLLTAALREVHEVLSAAGIWHCLAFGTLLGSVRHSDLIPWEHDIDLWVRPADRPAIASVSGERRVEFLPRTFEGGSLALNRGRIASFDIGVWTIRFHGTRVGELWAPTLFADGVLRQYDLASEVYFWPQASMPHHVFETLEYVVLRGGSYPAPADPPAVLEWIYGGDWRTPIRAPADGGELRERYGYSGDRVDPRLRQWLSRCEQRGWDRERYRGQPAWPRRILGAGPRGYSARAHGLSGSDWWQTFEELSSEY